MTAKHLHNRIGYDAPSSGRAFPCRPARTVLFVFLSALLVFSAFPLCNVMSTTAHATDGVEATTVSPAGEPSSDKLADLAPASPGAMAATDAPDSPNEMSDEDASVAIAGDGQILEAQDNESPNDANQDAPLVAMATGETDLNALWTNQEGGTSRSLTITAGGTYVLTDNLSVGGWMSIDAPGQDVTIDLRDRCLTFKIVDYEYLIGTKNCNSLTIIGNRPFAGIESHDAQGPTEQIVITEGKLAHAVESSCGRLVMRNVGIALKGHKDYATLEKLDACGVYVTRGSATLDNCSILVDHSIQARNGSTNTIKGFPKAVYVGKDVASAELSNCTLAVHASPVAQRKDSIVHELTSYDNAYGIFSSGDAQLTIRGGSITVDAPSSSATGVYGNKIVVEPSWLPEGTCDEQTPEEIRAALVDATILHLRCDGKERAFGLRTDASRGMSLNAALSCAIGEGSYPAYGAALVTSADDGVVFGASFAGEGIGVLAGSSLADANGNGKRFGVFANGVTSSTRQTILEALSNAQAGAACAISHDDAGLFFKLEAASAPVVLVGADGSETPCASVAEALRAQADGMTVQLRSDVGAITIDGQSVPPQMQKRKLAIDLNGHAVAGLTVDTSDDVRVFSSVGNREATVRGYMLSSRTVVVYRGTGDFMLENLRIEGVSQVQEGSALLVAGSGVVNLDAVDVQMCSHLVAARGVYQNAGDASVVIRNSDVRACSDANGVQVRAVASTVPKANIVISNSRVAARGLDSSTGAVDCAGSLEVSDCMLDASTRRAAASVFSVRLARDDAKASLCDVRLAATCDGDPTDGSYWCLMAGTPQPFFKSSWTLDGACSFESALDTHVNFLATPVTVGASFASANPIYVLGEKLEDDKVLALASPGPAACLDVFLPVAGSAYDGWSLQQQGQTSAVWWHEPIVENSRSHTAYPSLTRAFSEARAGDTLKLLGDCAASSFMELPVAVTLDLDGNALDITVAPYRILSSTASAFSLDGRGAHVFKNGSVNVRLCPDAALFDRSVSFRVLQASEDADITLSNVDLSVRVESEHAGSGDMHVQGIAACDASVTLCDGSTVSVTVACGQAVQASGIVYESSTRDASLSVDASSSIVVQNDASCQQRGEIAYPGNSVRYGKANLMRFYPAQGTELYDEIQAEFKRVAKADVEGDERGSVYNTNMYYAAPMTLSDGSYVWAFSKPLDAKDIGKLDKIEASVFYSQSYYDVIPTAQAIVLNGSMPDVRIHGNLDAGCTHGDATGICAELTQEDAQKGRESIVVEQGARIAVHANEESYRKRAGHLDLRDVIGLDGQTGKVVYPAYYLNVDYGEVVFAQTQSSALSGADKASVEVKDDRSLDMSRANFEVRDLAVGMFASLQTAPVSVTPAEVTVTFDNLHDDQGSLLEPESRVQAYGSSLASGGTLPVVRDYSWGGIIYRFVGWTLREAARGERTWDKDRIGELVLDESNDALTGEITLSAAYVPVAPGQHLARFKVDQYVDAYGVYDGASPDYIHAVRGSASTFPSKTGGTTMTSYGFRGWIATGASSPATYVGALPPATGDCSYEASFLEMPYRYEVRYYGWLPVQGTLQYAHVLKRVHDGTNGAGEAAQVAKEGDVLYDDAHVYSFIGWSPRQSDVESYFGFTPPLIPLPVDIDYGEEQYVYGIYDVRERRVPVSFYVDGQLYAQSDDLPTTTTVNGAFEATGAARPADKGDDLPFRGWSLAADDSNYLRGAVKTLASITTAEEPVTLHAVFGRDAAEAPMDNGGGAGDDGGEGNDDASPYGFTGRKSASLPASLSAGNMSAPASAATVSGLAPEGSALGEDIVSSGENAQASSSINMSLVALVLVALVMAAAIAWAGLRARRNRKLDREDDYYEPGSSDQAGEQVVF